MKDIVYPPRTERMMPTTLDKNNFAIDKLARGMFYLFSAKYITDMKSGGGNSSMASPKALEPLSPVSAVPRAEGLPCEYHIPRTVIWSLSQYLSDRYKSSEAEITTLGSHKQNRAGSSLV